MNYLNESESRSRLTLDAGKRRLARRIRNVIVVGTAAFVLGACGGGSDSGSGQDTTANAGNYQGNVTRIVLDGRPLPVGGDSAIFATLDNKGGLRLFDGSGWSRNLKIVGNRFSKQTNNVGTEVAGQVCVGPEIITGNLAGTTITGRVENRIQCDGQGQQVVFALNFRMDRSGATIARAPAGGSGIAGIRRAVVRAAL